MGSAAAGALLFLIQTLFTLAQVSIFYLQIAYGLILPPAVLALPRLGCINVHASLLPRWRGAAPVQRAILAGDAETGISILLVEQYLDFAQALADIFYILDRGAVDAVRAKGKSVLAVGVLGVRGDFRGGAAPSRSRARCVPSMPGR